MKTAFYQLEGGGNWILSPDINDQVKGSYYLKDMRFVNGSWNLGIIEPKDGSYLIALKVISDFTYQNGAPYRSPEEIERVCGKFFGTMGYAGGVSSPKDGWVRLTGDGGTNYLAPEDLDITALVAAWNPMDVEVSASNIGGIDTIVFAVAPEAGEFPLVRYTKK